MPNTIVAIATVNNLKFTKMCVESIRNTVKSPYRLLIVDDGSSDGTVAWAKQQSIDLIVHPVNLGLPYAVNDMYDYTWNKDKDAYLVIIANDAIVCDGAIDDLIRGLNETDFDLLGTREFNINQFLAQFPQYRNQFSTDGRAILLGDTFTAYKEMEKTVDKTFVVHERYPIMSLVIHRKSLFDKLGYYDVNYYPQYYCLTPDTPVLMNNLEWKPIGDVQTGDQMVGVDEYPENYRASRSYRNAVVEEFHELKSECARIVLEDGREMISSLDHRWLIMRPVSNGFIWRETARLKVGDRMCAPLEVWQIETEYDYGWLAGIVDGEGTVHNKGDHHLISFAQNQGAVLDRAKTLLNSMGIPFNKYDHSVSDDCTIIEIAQKPYMMELLGRLQPSRLNNPSSWEGMRVRSKNLPVAKRIVAIEPVGNRDVVGIQVSTRAFLANGVVSHNCDNDYAYRTTLTPGIKLGTVESCWMFHFWSRTIYEGGMLHINNKYFPRNHLYYCKKWGGSPTQERFKTPFNLGGAVNIFDRSYENDAVSTWRRM